MFDFDLLGLLYTQVTPKNLRPRGGRTDQLPICEGHETAIEHCKEHDGAHGTKKVWEPTAPPGKPP
jgi:hypothetical protein